MAEFQYIARDNSGERVSGTIAAATRREALAAIAARALFPVEVKGAGNYQTMINNALRECMSRGGEALEDVLRRVIREELKKAGRESEADVIPRGRL